VFLAEKLEISDITPGEIDTAHRVGPITKDGTQTLLVRFFRRELVDYILGSKKMLKGKNSSIFQDTTQKNRKLIYDLNQRPEVEGAWCAGVSIWAKLHSSNRKIRVGITTNLDKLLAVKDKDQPLAPQATNGLGPDDTILEPESLLNHTLAKKPITELPKETSTTSTQPPATPTDHTLVNQSVTDVSQETASTSNLPPKPKPTTAELASSTIVTKPPVTTQNSHQSTVLIGAENSPNEGGALLAFSLLNSTATLIGDPVTTQAVPKVN
jgi:hypothetical protein